MMDAIYSSLTDRIMKANDQPTEFAWNMVACLEYQAAETLKKLKLAGADALDKEIEIAERGIISAQNSAAECPRWSGYGA
jgi:hypothetical protein